MSLIDEALKRAQSAGQGEAGPRADRPWSPPPMPDAGLARGLRRRRRAAGAALLAVAAGAALLYLRRSPSGDAVSRARSRASALSPTAPLAVAQAPTALPVVVVAPPRSRRSEAPPVRPDGAARVVAGEAAVQKPVEVPAPRRDRLVSGKTYAGSVTLPEGARIELGGIVWSETEPRALLNDRVLGVGAYVEGFRVGTIETERVELRKDDLTIFLSVQ